MAIQQVTGRDYLRIEMFNDHPMTTHGMVVKVLNQARDNILSGVMTRPRTPTAPAAAAWWGGSLKPLSHFRRLFA